MLFVKVIIIFICTKIYVFRSGLSNGNLYRQKKFLPPARSFVSLSSLKNRPPHATIDSPLSPCATMGCFLLQLAAAGFPPLRRFHIHISVFLI